MSGLKSLALAGMGKQSVLATGVAASQYLPLVSENIRANSTPRGSDFRSGIRAQQFLGLGDIQLGGTIVEQMRYLLTTDPAHILLENLFGTAGGHVYRNTIRESFVTLRVAASDNEELAVSFTPAATPASQTIFSVRLYLKRVLAPSGNLTIEIQGDTTGDPDGTAISNGTSDVVVASTVSQDGAWVDFTFSTDPVLTGGTAYHLVLKGTYAASATDHVQWAVEDVASAGVFEIKDVSYADDATKNGVARILSSSFIDAFLLKNSTEGLFSTFAVDKQVSVHELVGMKVTALRLTSTPAEGLRASFDVIGYDEDQSPTTTAGILSGLKNVRDYALHKDLATVWVGDQVDVLAAADKWSVDRVECAITRPLDQIIPNGQRQVIEPLESDQSLVTLILSLPRYAADQWRTWQNAGTALQAKIQWTLSSKFITLLLPNLKIDGAIEIDTSDNAPYTQAVTLMAFDNQTANGFMQVGEELELNLLT